MLADFLGRREISTVYGLPFFFNSNINFKSTLFDFSTPSQTGLAILEEFKMGVYKNTSQSTTTKSSFRKAYNRLLEGNKEYVKQKMMQDPEYFNELGKSQKPKYLLIGCSDSRVPPNEMTKTDPGEIFIHRNIANQVIFSDLNCMSVIQYAVEHLKVEHIIVMGHTKCGGVISSNNKKFKGLIENWLQNIKDIALTYKKELDECQDEEEFIRKLTILNVRTQALNVCKTPFVQKAWSEGRFLHIHAWLMDIDTGLIHDLNITNNDWNEIRHIYDFIFH